MVCVEISDLQQKVSSALSERDLSAAEILLFSLDWLWESTDEQEDRGNHSTAAASPYHGYHLECLRTFEGLTDSLELLLKELGERREWFGDEGGFLKDFNQSQRLSLHTLKMLRESGKLPS